MINHLFFKHLKLIHQKCTSKPFNFMQAVDIEEKELSHSKLLHHFLDPNGNHQFQNKFLNLFLRQFKGKLQLDNFSTNNAEVKIEVFGSQKEDKTEGGKDSRIDLLICNGKNVIIIENKIKARDQPEQLSRYYNAMLKADYENINLIYLTPTGWSPENQSIVELPEKAKKNLILASYEYDIFNWISECKKIALLEQDNSVSEICTQYLNSIKNIVNRINGTRDLEYMLDTRDLLLTDDYLERFHDAIPVYEELQKEFLSSIWEKICENVKVEFGELHVDSILENASNKNQESKTQNKDNESIGVKLGGYEETYLVVFLHDKKYIYLGVHCEGGSFSEEYNAINEKTKEWSTLRPLKNMPVILQLERKINFKDLSANDLSYIKIEKNQQEFANKVVDQLKDISEKLNKTSKGDRNLLSRIFGKFKSSGTSKRQPAEI